MTAATTPDIEITTELDGHTFVHKAWTVKQVMAFRQLLKSDSILVTDLVEAGREKLLEGLISCDGKSGDEATEIIDNLIPSQHMAVLRNRSNKCYASAEDKKKSES